MKITIYDLAKELGTTASTVSRALQNHPRISSKTREAVLALAKKHNYHIDPVAQHLRTGKGSVIGVIVPRIDRHFFATVIGGIENVAHEKGYSVIVSQSHERYEDEKAIVRLMASKKVDGLAVSLASATEDIRHFEGFLSGRTPVVFFDRVPNDTSVCRVQVDNFEAVYRSVQHLLEQGCRRIAHFAGPQNLSVYTQRREGYLKALSDARLPILPELIFENTITSTAGEEAGEAIFQMINRPDGIVSAGDYSAVGAMHVLRSRGVVIPDDIAIVGFANEPFNAYIEPALSSVDQATLTMGNEVARLLLELMDTPQEERVAKQIILATQLIERRSSLHGKTK